MVLKSMECQNHPLVRWFLDAYFSKKLEWIAERYEWLLNAIKYDSEQQSIV